MWFKKVISEGQCFRYLFFFKFGDYLSIFIFRFDLVSNFNAREESVCTKACVVKRLYNYWRKYNTPDIVQLYSTHTKHVKQWIIAPSENNNWNAKHKTDIKGSLYQDHRVLRNNWSVALAHKALIHAFTRSFEILNFLDIVLYGFLPMLTGVMWPGAVTKLTGACLNCFLSSIHSALVQI